MLWRITFRSAETQKLPTGKHHFCAFATACRNCKTQAYVRNVNGGNCKSISLERMGQSGSKKITTKTAQTSAGMSRRFRTWSWSAALLSSCAQRALLSWVVNLDMTAWSQSGRQKDPRRQARRSDRGSYADPAVQSQTSQRKRQAMKSIDRRHRSDQLESGSDSRFSC